MRGYALVWIRLLRRESPAALLGCRYRETWFPRCFRGFELY